MPKWRLTSMKWTPGSFPLRFGWIFFWVYNKKTLTSSKTSFLPLNDLTSVWSKHFKVLCISTSFWVLRRPKSWSKHIFKRIHYKWLLYIRVDVAATLGDTGSGFQPIWRHIFFSNFFFPFAELHKKCLYISTSSSAHWNKRHTQPSLCLCLLIGTN